jgi:hypothetical protein
MDADLAYAILSGADLSKVDLSGATYDAQTKWPEDFDPEHAGAVNEPSGFSMNRWLAND